MRESILDRLNNTQLRKYCQFFLKNLDIHRIDITSLENFYQVIMSDSEFISKVSSPVGRRISRLDIEYLFYILMRVDVDSSWDSETEAPVNKIPDDVVLYRPTLKAINVDFHTETRMTEYLTRSSRVATYTPEEVTGQYFYDLFDQEEIEPYDWKITNELNDDLDNLDSYFEPY